MTACTIRSVYVGHRCRHSCSHTPLRLGSVTATVVAEEAEKQRTIPATEYLCYSPKRTLTICQSRKTTPCGAALSVSEQLGSLKSLNSQEDKI